MIKTTDTQQRAIEALLKGHQKNEFRIFINLIAEHCSQLNKMLIYQNEGNRDIRAGEVRALSDVLGTVESHMKQPSTTEEQIT